MLEFASIGSHRSGIESEGRVFQDLIQKKYRLLYWRARTPFAEVDLIFQDTCGDLCMVEVKTSFNDFFEGYQLRSGQKKRLLRAREFLQNQLQKEVCLLLALVRKEDIEYLQIEE